jgi:hypothetical protein
MLVLPCSSEIPVESCYGERISKGIQDCTLQNVILFFYALDIKAVYHGWSVFTIQLQRHN